MVLWDQFLIKKLLKSEICRSVNSVRDPHVAENWWKNQTFLLKKKNKKQRQKRKRVWKAQNTLPKRILNVVWAKDLSRGHTWADV